MKKFIPIILLAFVFSSCEVIEGPYMSDSINPIDTTTNNYVKNILIELLILPWLEWRMDK